MASDNSDELVDRLRDTIGKEVVFQAPDELGRSSFRLYALAIGDTNPLYSDRDFSKAHGLRDVIAPATLVCDTWQFVDSDMSEDGSLLALGEGLDWKGLRAGNDYEFFQPVHPDDIITARRTTTDVFQKTGRSGRLVFWEVETAYSNQKGELLATNLEIMFRRI